jgi:hypothetical protein
MMEQLDTLVRFWELRARYDRVGAPLNQDERVELLSLRLVAAQEDRPGEALDASKRGVPAQLTAGTGFLAADVKDLSPERIIVGAAETIPLGHRTILCIADAVTGLEYTVPCQVVWARRDEPCLMGLVPDGVPLRVPFVSPAPGLWRSPLGIGPVGRRVRA